MSTKLTNNESINFQTKLDADNVSWGLVDKIDTKKQTMRVLIPDTPHGKPTTADVSIGNPVTNYGAGFRLMPLSGGRTAAYIYEDTGGKYYHIGYVNDKIGEITDDITGEAQEIASNVLIRNLEEGETQMTGLYGNEVFLAIDGSVLLKSQFGSYLKLDNYMSRLDGNFSNLKYELDGVRLRMGNVIRPTREDTTEDQYMVYGLNDIIKGADTLEDEEEWTPLKEFTVQVGTLQDSENNYVDYEDPFLSPTVGTFSMSDTYVRENGRGLFSAGQAVTCYLRMASGGGFMVTEDGSFHIMDYTNWSSIKFPSGGNPEIPPERSLRLRNSIVSVATSSDTEAAYETEILMSHESGAQIEIREGYIELTEATGRTLTMNNYGCDINVPDAAVTITAKDIMLLTDGGSVSIGGFPTDGVVKATHASMMFDQHIHAGPSGPPVPAFHWTPLIQIPNSPLVAQSFKVG